MPATNIPRPSRHRLGEPRAGAGARYRFRPTFAYLSSCFASLNNVFLITAFNRLAVSSSFSSWPGNQRIPLIRSKRLQMFKKKL
jgi:hypothetical protein